MSLAVELDHCTLRYGGRAVLDDVSLKVDPGKFSCVIGSSGSGKSTLLSLVSGLLAPAGGEVRVGGKVVAGVDPRVQLIFQNGALFDWMSVRENVEFGLRAARVPPEVSTGEVDGYLRLVGLSDVAGARLHELSGGMAQRVAIARALVLQPQVLLMDEPFSALDAITRENLQVELLRLWEETGVTVVFVTHNLREAILLGDDIHLLGAGGRVEASWPVGVPRSEREHHPALRPLENELRARLHVAHPGSAGDSDLELAASGG
ncbi:MAG TPA: ABC transporter ATP-binding protein [Candidatus Dormibacteraeota bacterium]